jgi:hypothetical protein
MQPQPPHGFGGALAPQGLVDPMEVIGRQAGHVGEARQVDVLVEVIGQPPEDALQPDRVVVRPCRFAVHDEDATGPGLT